jgi:hypothetical protein
MSTTISTITQYGYAYIVPSICGFGIVCNIINLTVLLNKRLKESPYTYLTGLATFDILTLLFTLSMTFTRSQSLWFSYEIDLIHDFIMLKLEKRFFLPTANLFSPMSVLITVALTLERFLFTRFPMKASSFCLPEYARKVVFILFIAVFIFRIPVYLFYDVKIVSNLTNLSKLENYTLSDIKNLCHNGSNVICRIEVESFYENFQKFYYFMSFVLFQIIPVLLLSLLNVSLIMMVRKAYNESELLQKSDVLKTNHSEESHCLSDCKLSLTPVNIKKCPSLMVLQKIPSSANISLIGAQNHQINKVKDSKRIRDQVKLTRTVIAVLFFALVSEIVSILTYDKIADFLIGRHYKNYMKNGYEIQKLISNSIVVISHSVNFFLYCAFNTRYFDVLKLAYSSFFKRLPFISNTNLTVGGRRSNNNSYS